MYEAFFGLREAPFGLTPDTEFFFANNDHQDALDTLLLALQMGEGFIKVSGEVGTGKTLICRKLLKQLETDERFVSAYIPNPTVTPAAMLQSIIGELGLPKRCNMSPVEAIERLNCCLIERKQTGQQVVLILDEAQALSHESLETLRLLTNLETEKSKLLHVVLFAQPELDQRLAQNDLRQLRQRITFSHKLCPMKPDVVATYLEHRLRVAGYEGEPVFTLPLAVRLHKASGGVPRLLNILAHKSLLLAFGEGRTTLNRSHVQRAVADTESIVKGTLRLTDHMTFLGGALSASAALFGALWAVGLG